MVQSFLSDGVRIAFIDVAPEAPDRGEPILLIHGFASNHRVNWVDPRWVETLSKAGRRVVAFDNRGHGESEKLYEPRDYHSATMAHDAANLLDHLDIGRADAMGYSMGARIASFLALAEPERVRALILGGLGDRLVEGDGLPLDVAEAMEAPSLDSLTDPMQRMFRAFAEQTNSDLRGARRLRPRFAPDLQRGRGCAHRLSDAGRRGNARRGRGRPASPRGDVPRGRGAGDTGAGPQSRRSATKPIRRARGLSGRGRDAASPSPAVKARRRGARRASRHVGLVK